MHVRQVSLFLKLSFIASTLRLSVGYARSLHAVRFVYPKRFTVVKVTAEMTFLAGIVKV
jgi:hypothetical protein